MPSLPNEQPSNSEAALAAALQRLETRPPFGLVWDADAARPIGAGAEGAALWFRLMEAAGAIKGEVTAGPLAKALGDAKQSGFVQQALEGLEKRGDLRWVSGRRYRAEARDKRLLAHLERDAHEDGPGWEAFWEAAEAYATEPIQRRWTALASAFDARLSTYPGWPESARAALLGVTARAIGAIAGVAPPAHEALGDPVAEAQRENERLKAENASLRRALEAARAAAPASAPAGGRNAELKTRIAELEAELDALRDRNAALEARLAKVDALADDPLARATDFLAGQRGPFPPDVPEAELRHMRRLVAQTGAPYAVRLALVEKLVSLFRNPNRGEKLTAGKGARRIYAHGMRIAFTLEGGAPRILALGPRENFYRFTSRL